MLKLEKMLDVELSGADLASLFRLFLSAESHFMADYLASLGDIDISVGPWEAESFQHGEETFSHVRAVSTKHPPKARYPGLPKYASASKVYRYALLPLLPLSAGKEDRADGSTMSLSPSMQRIVILETTRMSGIPLSDCFHLESRWVFSSLAGTGAAGVSD